MDNEFTLEELKGMLFDKENPVGSDEFIILMAEYIGDKDIEKATENLVEEFYRY